MPQFVHQDPCYYENTIIFHICAALCRYSTAQLSFHYDLTVPKVISPPDKNLIDMEVRRVSLEGDEK